MKKWLSLIFVFSVVVGFSFWNVPTSDIKNKILGTSTGLADSAWPMFHGGPQHGGLSPYDTSHVDGTVKWKINLQSDVKYIPFIETSPVIAEDGSIYVTTHDTNLYAVSSEGKLKWTFEAGSPVFLPEYNTSKGILSTPAVGRDGTIYFTTMESLLFAVSKDGKEKWRVPILTSDNHGWVSPLIGNDGTIYVSSSRQDDFATKDTAGVYAFNPDGSIKWYFPHSFGGGGSPSITRDGKTIYASGYRAIGKMEEDKGNGLIFALDSRTGEMKWEFLFKEWMESHPTIGEDGTVYFGTKKGEVHALNPDGTEKWRFDVPDIVDPSKIKYLSKPDLDTLNGISGAPAIDKNGTIYIGSWNAYLYAINPDGTLKWKLKTPPGYEAFSSGPIIGAEGTIYIVSLASGRLYAVSPEGKELWTFYTSPRTFGLSPASPAIGTDGTIYLTGNGGNLFALGGSKGKGISNKLNQVFPKLAATQTESSMPILEIGLIVVVGIVGIIIFVKKRKSQV